MRSFDRKVSVNPAIKLLGFLDEHFVRMSRGGLFLAELGLDGYPNGYLMDIRLDIG
jgi:hypothetical protein